MGKTNNRVLECYLCKITMKCNKVSNLRRHMALHGPIVNCIKCMVCGTYIQNKSNMKTHWIRAHKDFADNNIPPKMISTSRKATCKIIVLFEFICIISADSCCLLINLILMSTMLRPSLSGIGWNDKNAQTKCQQEDTNIKIFPITCSSCATAFFWESANFRVEIVKSSPQIIAFNVWSHFVWI